MNLRKTVNFHSSDVPTFKSNCYKKFVTGINVRLLATESDQGGGSTSQDYPPHHSIMPPATPVFGRMHSNSEDNICVE
jgi:hypothetical protein